jgi:hypothetical protein
MNIQRLTILFLISFFVWGCQPQNQELKNKAKGKLYIIGGGKRPLD